MSHDPNDALAELLDRTLAQIPSRRAPASLESRVLSALESRADLPWWRRSFAHWPQLARVAFLVICGALIGLAIVGGATASAGVRSLGLARQFGDLVVSANTVAALLAHIALPTWVYEAILACGALYAVLFGLSAALYRTLYLHTVDGR